LHLQRECAANGARAAQEESAVEYERAAVCRTVEAVEQHAPSIKCNRALQFAEHNARFANQHFGVRHVHAPTEHGTGRRAANPDVDARLAVDRHRGCKRRKHAKVGVSAQREIECGFVGRSEPRSAGQRELATARHRGWCRPGRRQRCRRRKPAETPDDILRRHSAAVDREH
jgi:hypothetical protein